MTVVLCVLAAMIAALAFAAWAFVASLKAPSGSVDEALVFGMVSDGFSEPSPPDQHLTPTGRLPG